MKLTSTLVAGLLIAASALSLSAQVAYTSAGSTYTQNFDNLFGAVPANNTTVDAATTLPAGWSVVEAGANANALLRVHGVAATGATPTGLTTGDSFLYGASLSNERAFGSYASGSLNTVFGLHLQNTSGATISDFTLTFDGEQWMNGRNASAINNTLTFSYGVGNASLTAGSFTTVAGLNFTAPVGGTTTPDESRDGNDSASRTASISASVTGITWANGQSLWLRWTDANDVGNDDGLAVDNLSFTTTAVPEPSAYAALAGVAILGFAALRRRRA